jgi:hypothetical protein
MEVLRGELLFTKFRAYSSQSALSKTEHDALHSQVNGSSVKFPHSFVGYPIFRVPGDSKSEIVAYAGSGFAWDFALRNLLPEGVDGIIVKIENNCNQSASYQIAGREAFYIGDGELHETKYNHMKVFRSLSVYNHPNFTTTPGHCFYSMVSLRKFKVTEPRMGPFFSYMPALRFCHCRISFPAQPLKKVTTQKLPRFSPAWSR